MHGGRHWSHWDSNRLVFGPDPLAGLQSVVCSSSAHITACMNTSEERCDMCNVTSTFQEVHMLRSGLYCTVPELGGMNC